MGIPLVDLQIQHRQVAAEIEAGLARVMRQGSFILGPDVEKFERAFAAYCDVSHCIGVANGTDALELALRATGIGPGDEVILPVNTFIATALAVARAGAVPVFVDCDEQHGLIDVEAARAATGPKTKALLPVHLYGQMAAMQPLEKLARESGLLLLEDAAQSQGARQADHAGERASGSVGVVAATSFYPGKNLGAYGDAGAVLTNDEAVAGHVRELRNYGSERKYHHPRVGFNSRLDSLQAVVLNAKLAHLDDWNEQRREAAARYDELLGSVDAIRLPGVATGNTAVWHLYVVRVAGRDAVLEALHDKGIGAAIHYPFPLHRTGAFQGNAPRGAFPVAERRADEILSLPLYPGITAEQQEEVARALVDSIDSIDSIESIESLG